MISKRESTFGAIREFMATEGTWRKNDFIR